MAGDAVDIAMANHDPAAFEAVARKAGFLGFDFHSLSGFMHVDTGPARQWGECFPPRAVPFAVETTPARETLADSRTLKGGGIAGVATLGGAGVEIAQEALGKTQGALLALIPTSTSCAGSSSRWRWPASRCRSRPGWTTGAGIGVDRRATFPAATSHRRDRAAASAGSPRRDVRREPRHTNPHVSARGLSPDRGSIPPARGRTCMRPSPSSRFRPPCKAGVAPQVPPARTRIH